MRFWKNIATERGAARELFCTKEKTYLEQLGKMTRVESKLPALHGMDKSV